MPRWLWIVLAVLLATLWWSGKGGSTPALSGAAGAVACPLPDRFDDPASPRQSSVGDRIAPFVFNGATVTPLAGFSLQARVLSREDYRLGTESRFSPTDLALGWGPMAAEGLADRLSVRQSGRWYRYSWGGEGPPLAPAAIAGNSANMHIVPGDAAVARRLDSVRAGETVRLQGWLIRIDDPSGWRWTSSLTRQDTGEGSCELILACALD